MLRLACSFFISFLFSLSASYACINYYVRDSSGRTHMMEDHVSPKFHVAGKKEANYLEQLVAKLKAPDEANLFRLRSDYCAALLELGRAAEALPLLQQLVAANPDQYNVQANLAVAYELTGDPKKALEHLKLSLRLNPGAHNNSEWVHLRILEAQQNRNGQSPAYASMNILKLADKKEYAAPYQLLFQLHERVPLTPAPNELLSKALQESGDYFNATLSMEMAIELYAMAIAYDNGVQKEVLWNKIKRTRRKLAAYGPQRKPRMAEYLFKADWKTGVDNIINQWKDYKPYRYEGTVIASFE